MGKHYAVNKGETCVKYTERKGPKSKQKFTLRLRNKIARNSQRKTFIPRTC